jgi:hypothetical protein
MRPIHAVPLDARGPHVPLPSCPCHPIEATDLEEPGAIIVIHRHATWPRDQMPPPEADALLWRSRPLTGDIEAGAITSTSKDTRNVSRRSDKDDTQ